MKPASTDPQAWNPVHRLSMLCLVAYLLTMFGRLPELAAQYTGSGLFLAPLTLAGVLLGIILAGGGRRAILSVPGALWIAFTLWMLACIPFSAWPGGSVQFLRDTYWKYVVIFFATAGMIRTRRDLQWAMYALGSTSIVILAMSFLLGRNNAVDDRFEVSFGSFQNPNDLATALLVTAPFLLLFAMRYQGMSFRRVAAAVLLIATLVTILKTGSRGALLCTVIIAMYTFWQASMSTKIKLAPALLLGAVLFFLLLPAPLVNRYATILHLGSGSDPSSTEFTDESAVASANQRKELLALSIELTFAHPLFGVGPGAFVYAADEVYKSRGEKSPWLQSHNSYTQVSSETGFLGLLLFGSLMAYSGFHVYRLYRRTRRPELAAIHDMAFCLLLSVFSYAVCAFFASIAYMGYLPVLSALTLGLVRVAAKEMPVSLRAAQPQPAAATVPTPTRPSYIGPAPARNWTRSR